MRLTTHPRPADFLAAVTTDLEANEAEHSLILGVALGLEGSAAGAYLATVHDDGGLVLAALLEPSRPLALDGPRPAPAEALDALIRDLLDGGPPVPAVSVPTAWVDEFLDRWAAAGGAPLRTAMRQRLHVLRAVEPIPAAAGRLRRATPDDGELVASWIHAMHREALGEGDAERARRTAERRTGAGEIFLWENGEPLTMAARARPTRHTVSVNEVYTPPALRGRGYATACVARLSQHLLDAGYSRCVLFTDLANPTSNGIYARIGYRPARDFHLLRADRG